MERRLKHWDLPRVYLKTVNAPGQRAFSRCAASFFLEIRQYSCEKMSCSARKFLAAGHITSFQIHPRRTLRQITLGVVYRAFGDESIVLCDVRVLFRRWNLGPSVTIGDKAGWIGPCSTAFSFIAVLTRFCLLFSANPCRT